MRRVAPLTIAAALVSATGCGTAPTQAPPTLQAQQESPSTPSPTADPLSTFTRQEKRFLTAVHKDPEAASDASDPDLVSTGRIFCQLDPDDLEVYEGFGDPMNAEGIFENKDSVGTLERSAVRFLCPKFIPAWKAGMAAFDDGDHVVGDDVKPGRYKTFERKVKNCYWERTGKGGQTLANNFVTFAAGGVTAAILPTDGGFTSKGCGLWVPA